MKGGQCRSCGAAITWLRTERGKPIPLDREPVDGGNIEVEGETAKVVSPEPGVKRFVSHFVTCPQRREWRMPWPAASSSTPITPSTAGSSSGPMTMPTIQLVILWPTATATSTPRPTMVPTSTPIPLDVIYPACGPDLPGGTTCRPERPATTPTPYPVCADGFYPALCVVPGDGDAMSARSETK